MKRAERIVIELMDKAPAFSDLDPSVIRLSGEVEDKRAPRPVLDAVSALSHEDYARDLGSSFPSVSKAKRISSSSP